MKTLPYNPALVAEDAVSAKASLKVCMHLADIARADFRVMRDATALVKAGFEVTIVDVERDRLRSVEEEIDGVYLKHIILPGWFISSRFKLWFLIKLVVLFMNGVIQLLRTEVDIYHAHVEKALPACYIAALLSRKPLIFDAPDLTLSDPSIRKWRRLRTLSIHLIAQMVQRCAGVITASPFYAQEIRKIYHASEITLVRNVPTYRAVPKSDRLREHLELSPNVRIALYQGNLQPNRALDKLVYSAAFLEKNTVIVMMGNAVPSTLSQLQALIASNGVADRVKVISAVPYEELLDWTASADIGLTLFPPDYSLSIRYTLPNKLFEYLMAGLPVLTAQLDAIAEIIKTYDVGQIVSSLAPEDIGIAINAMLVDDVALDRMHRNALEAAKHEFYWEKESQALIGLYHDVLRPMNEVKTVEDILR